MEHDTQRDDDKLDETLRETFPASDAPANTVETGIGAGLVSSSPTEAVADNRGLHRFELTVNGQTAFLKYERTPEKIVLIHTEVPTGLRGHHIGERLVEAALHAGRAAGLQIVAVCPFVRAYLRKHPSR